MDRLRPPTSRRDAVAANGRAPLQRLTTQQRPQLKSQSPIQRRAEETAKANGGVGEGTATRAVSFPAPLPRLLSPSRPRPSESAPLSAKAESPSPRATEPLRMIERAAPPPLPQIARRERPQPVRRDPLPPAAPPPTPASGLPLPRAATAVANSAGGWQGPRSTSPTYQPYFHPRRR